MHQLEELRNGFRVFLGTNGIRNTWITTPLVSVYVRKTHRKADGELILAIDLANIEVDDEHRREGIFKQALAILKEEAKNAGYRMLYCENVLNDNLLQWFIRQNWKFEKDLAGVYSFAEMLT